MNSPYRILVVEDSHTQAIVLSDILEREGWQVSWAPTAQSAMDQIGQNRPDLIVLDYYLPGIRGDEFCRRIRMNIDTRGIPILILTMEGSHDAEIHGLESGADDFVAKSIDPDILLLRIRTLLAKSTTRETILSSADFGFQRARLLTIDDSPTFQEFLTEELRKEGYEVANAPGGIEGLKLLNESRFDCVLVDLVMPEMNRPARAQR